MSKKNKVGKTQKNGMLEWFRNGNFSILILIINILQLAVAIAALIILILSYT